MIELQLESLPRMVEAVWSNDVNLQLEATSNIRKLLGFGMHCLFSYFISDNQVHKCLLLLRKYIAIEFIERSPPIVEVIQSGVVPRIVEFLTSDIPMLQVMFDVKYCFFHLIMF